MDEIDFSISIDRVAAARGRAAVTLGSRGLHTASPENAAWLSITAYIRHRLTDYDNLLDEGYDMESARFFVLDDMNAVLEEWGSPRRVQVEDETD